MSQPIEKVTVCVTRWWAGRDNATLPEPSSSHANYLKTRTLSLRAAAPPAVPDCPKGPVEGSGARCVRPTHRTPTFLTRNELQTHLDQILSTTKTLARTDKLQPTINAGWHVALHQVHVVATGSQTEVSPTMLTIERKRSRICGANAQLGHLNSMPTHKIHCIVMKFAADARASHLLDQVKEVQVPTSWLLEDLHLHLSDDLVAVPSVNASVWELSNTQPKPLNVVHAVGSVFVEKAILAEAADERVASERDTHRRMCVEIDWLEYESLELHKLVRLTARVN
jgi:hypothetical protein